MFKAPACQLVTPPGSIMKPASTVLVPAPESVSISPDLILKGLLSVPLCQTGCVPATERTALLLLLMLLLMVMFPLTVNAAPLNAALLVKWDSVVKSPGPLKVPFIIKAGVTLASCAALPVLTTAPATWVHACGN